MTVSTRFCFACASNNARAKAHVLVDGSDHYGKPMQPTAMCINHYYVLGAEGAKLLPGWTR
jgi:hypothetical protein